MPVAVRGCPPVAPGHIPTGVSLVHQCFPDLLIFRAFGAGPYGLIRYHYLSAPCLSAPVFLFFDARPGFLLSRAGATTFDFHAHLLLLVNLQSLWIIANTMTIGMISIFIMKRLQVRFTDGQGHASADNQRRVSARHRLEPDRLHSRREIGIRRQYRRTDPARAAGLKNWLAVRAREEGVTDYTGDKAGALLAASRFHAAVAGSFGSLNDLAQIGQLHLQGLDRFCDFHGLATGLALVDVTCFQLCCALRLTHVNLLVRFRTCMRTPLDNSPTPDKEQHASLIN
jgi:hypothetical protein